MTIPSSPDDNQHRLWRLAPLLVVAFALVLRAYYINTASVDHPIRGDATQYYAYALNLLKHGTFSMDSIEAASPVPDSYRDPGYPFFLYVLMTVFGTAKVWYGAVLLLQSLLGALTAGLATRLGQYWLPLPCPASVQRSALAHPYRGCQNLLRGKSLALRHHRRRALQSLGVRRRQSVQSGIL